MLIKEIKLHILCIIDSVSEFGVLFVKSEVGKGNGEKVRKGMEESSIHDKGTAPVRVSIQ